jgi:transposase
VRHEKNRKPGRPISLLSLSDEDRAELERRIKAPTASKRDSLRASIVLKRAAMGQAEAAESLGCSEACVSRWTARFRREGLAGLKDAPGRGRKPYLDPSRVETVITRVNRPPKGHARWSVRTMARESGVSRSSVSRIWRANDLKPHLKKGFKLSDDPDFERKFWDVVGLYLDPPERALVLCCDEKSQCQALERTQRALPLVSGHAKTFTHDYIRHGTLTLFAALNYLDGKVVGRLGENHTHKEWLLFLKQIDRELPRGRDAAPDPRQLRHAQEGGSHILDGEAERRVREAARRETLRHALHADVKQLAQPGRALLRRHHAAGAAQRQLRQRQGARATHTGLHRRAQSGAETVCLEGGWQGDPGKDTARQTETRGDAIRQPHLRDRALEAASSMMPDQNSAAPLYAQM